MNSVKGNYHKKLADYFESRWREPYIRALDELPWQRTKTRDWEGTERILTDLKFIEEKSIAFSIFNVLRDFLNVLDEIPHECQEWATLSVLHNAMDADSYVLKEDPSLFIQQMYNLLVWDWDETTMLGQAIRKAATNYQRIWFKRVNRLVVAAPEHIRVLTGHSGSVWSVAFSPDGKTLMSGSGTTFKSGEVRLYNVDTGILNQLFVEHNCSVGPIAWSPDGKLIASGCERAEQLEIYNDDYSFYRLCRAVLCEKYNKPTIIGEVKLRDSLTGELKQTLSGHRHIMNTVIFSSDSRILVSGSDDGVVQLWDLQSGKLYRTFIAHTTRMSSVTISPNDKILASIGGREEGRRDRNDLFGDVNMNQEVILWDLHTGEKLWSAGIGEFRKNPGSSIFANPVTISPNGMILACGCVDLTVKLFDVQTGRLTQTLTGYSGPVHSVVFSPDSKLLISGSDIAQTYTDIRYGGTIAGGEVKIWDLQSVKLKQVISDHRWSLNSVAVSPEGSILASGSGDETIRFSKLQLKYSGNLLTKYSDWIRSAAFSSDGKTLASGSTDFMVRLWDVKVEGLKEKQKWNSGGIVYELALSPDGKTFVTNGKDGLQLWESQTGKKQKLIKRKDCKKMESLFSLSFSPDGKILACSIDGRIELYDVLKGILVQTLLGHEGTTYSIAFSADGKTLASYGNDELVKLWDVQTGRLKRTVTENGCEVKALALSPDGNILASGTWRLVKNIRLWDTQNGELLAWVPCTDDVLALCFDPCLQRLWVAGAGGVEHKPNVYALEIVQTTSRIYNWEHIIQVKELLNQKSGTKIQNGKQNDEMEMLETKVRQNRLWWKFWNNK